MKAARYIGLLVLVALLLFVFVVNFSVVESRFECSGELSSDGSAIPATVYTRFEEYRWWVGLWSDSDGALWLEIPNQALDYFRRIAEVGDQLQIFDAQNALKGNFSTLSNRLALNTPLGFFDGPCRRIDR